MILVCTRRRIWQCLGFVILLQFAMMLLFFRDNIYGLWNEHNVLRSTDPNDLKGIPVIHFIYNAQPSKYHEWQSRYSYYWFKKSGQSRYARYTRIVSGSGEDHLAVEIPTFVAPPHNHVNDNYLPYNKPVAVLAWLQSPEGRAADFVVILDPDCVLIRPLVFPDKTSSSTIWVDVEKGPYRVAKGAPLSQISYLDTSVPAFGSLARRYCVGCPFAQSIAVPIVIEKTDLDLVAPGWLSITEKMREERQSWEEEWTASNFGLDWTTEMYGYMFSAGQKGIMHTTLGTVQDIVGYNHDLRAPILHYSLKVFVDEKSEQFWHKNQVDAATVIPSPEGVRDPVAKRLLEELRDARDSLAPTAFDFSGIASIYQPAE